MTAEIIGQQMTLIDWRGCPPQLLFIQLTRRPAQESDDFRVDVCTRLDLSKLLRFFFNRGRTRLRSASQRRGSSEPVRLAFDNRFSLNKSFTVLVGKWADPLEKSED
ncbi:hypothetical protein U1Q18_052178 [Sarracenia purpurea var. burkii]